MEERSMEWCFCPHKALKQCSVDPNRMWFLYWAKSLCLVTSLKALLAGWALREFQKSPLSRLDWLGEFFNNPQFNSNFFTQWDLLGQAELWASSSNDMALSSFIPELPRGLSLRASSLGDHISLGELSNNGSFQSSSQWTRTLSKTYKKLVNSKDLFTMTKILWKHQILSNGT